MKVYLEVHENNSDQPFYWVIPGPLDIHVGKKEEKEPRPLSYIYKNQFQIIWNLNKKGKAMKLLKEKKKTNSYMTLG